MKIFFLTIFSMFFSYYLLKKSFGFLNKYFIDVPNLRSSHEFPKPRGGGLIFILIGGLFSYLAGSYIPLLCIPLALVGVLDDLFKISPLLRYLAQFLTVVSIFFWYVKWEFIFEKFPFLISIIICIIIIITGTAIINFSNFMDGIDGLVGGCFAVILLSSSFLVGPSILPLTGSIIGFLILNWSPSKVFMGDSGSTFLGAVLTCLVFSSNNLSNSFALLLIALPILADSFICVIRRFANRENIFEAHKLHLYQRLYQGGWTHQKISSIYIISTIFLSSAYLFFGFKLLLTTTVFVLMFGVYLDKTIAVPFCNRKFNS